MQAFEIENFIDEFSQYFHKLAVVYSELALKFTTESTELDLSTLKDKLVVLEAELLETRRRYVISFDTGRVLRISAVENDQILPSRVYESAEAFLNETSPAYISKFQQNLFLKLNALAK